MIFLGVSCKHTDLNITWCSAHDFQDHHSERIWCMEQCTVVQLKSTLYPFSIFKYKHHELFITLLQFLKLWYNTLWKCFFFFFLNLITTLESSVKMFAQRNERAGRLKNDHKNCSSWKWNLTPSRWSVFHFSSFCWSSAQTNGQRVCTRVWRSLFRVNIRWGQSYTGMSCITREGVPVSVNVGSILKWL